MIYLDSSALLKLLITETESASFAQWLDRNAAQRFVGSSLVWVEVRRACRRYAPDALLRVPAVLAEVGMVPLADDVLAAAGDLTDPTLRSLDAIHLATAVSLGPEVGVFVTYDRRLAAAASSAGFEVVAPGAQE